MGNRWGLVCLIAAVFAAASGNAAAQTSRSAVRIGVFDSRAVALAYYNSPEQQQLMRAMVGELEKARASGDARRVKELELQGPILQARMHWQVFSSLSIPNILDKVADRIPGIANEAGVLAVASKWEISYKDSSVEYVDITSLLVALFHPDARVQKWIEQMSGKDPIPLDKLPPEPNY
jgi:hypothetical protein